MGGGKRFSHCCRKEQFENQAKALTMTCSRFACCCRSGTENILIKKGRRHEGVSEYDGGWVRSSTSLRIACSFGPKPRMRRGRGGTEAAAVGGDESGGVGCNIFLFFFGVFFSASKAFRKHQASGHGNTQHLVSTFMLWVDHGNEVIH